MNIQDIFSGKVAIDSVQTLDSLTVAREDTLDGAYQTGRRIPPSIRRK